MAFGLAAGHTVVLELMQPAKWRLITLLTNVVSRISSQLTVGQS